MAVRESILRLNINCRLLSSSYQAFCRSLSPSLLVLFAPRQPLHYIVYTDNGLNRSLNANLPTPLRNRPIRD